MNPAPTTTAAAAVVERLRLRRRLPSPAVRRAVRQSSGLSASEIADLLGVTRQTVSRWELGIRTPRGEQLEAYVEILEQLTASGAA